MTFYEKFMNLCIEKDVSPSKVTVEIGLTPTSATGWKDGAVPRNLTIRKICRYFDVPLSYFEESEKPSAESRELTDAQRRAIDLIKSIDDDAVLEIFIAAMEKAIKK